MKAQKLLTALNEIDEKYILQAEPSPARQRARHVFGMVPQLAAGLACVLMVGLLCLGGLLFSNSVKVSDAGMSGDAASSEACAVADALPEEAEAAEETPWPDQNAAEVAEDAAMYVSDVPALPFPTEEEFAKKDFGTGSYTTDCRAFAPTPLSRVELAAIWDDSLFWEEMEPLFSEEDWELWAGATYDEAGALLMVELELELIRNGSESETAEYLLGPALHVYITPGEIRPPYGQEEMKVHNSCEVYGTEVTAYAAYFRTESNKAGEYAEDFARYAVTFLRDGEEPLGVRALALCGPGVFSREQAKELLARLTAFSLDPEKQFSISQLEGWNYLTEPWSETEHCQAELDRIGKYVAEKYAASWLEIPATSSAYPPLAECFVTGFTCTEAPEDMEDADVKVMCTLVFRPEAGVTDLGAWWAGNTVAIEDGFYSATRFVYAGQTENGWEIVSAGTGP